MVTSRAADATRPQRKAAATAFSVCTVVRMTGLTEGEIERGVTALVPYVQEWGLPLNPEDLQAVAVAVLIHSRSDASNEEIDQFERDWIRKNRQAAAAELSAMRKAAIALRGDVPVVGLTADELTIIEGRAASATHGPWKAFIEGRDHTSGADFIRTGGLDDAAPDLYLSHDSPDRTGLVVAPMEDHDFIAHARQDVPRLVAEVRRLRSLIEAGSG